ncbi:GNAT family N-acetyltransferase [Merismopedia glauca]|uniref:GNAT family N-acetyltransferase n=1 Tax=Merismopedia glauca CCAP 1448/3 TaxID=1296344 RepID=A0A2T1BYZ5_9CYAN|nr:GNAT family N-acetyltransferase [Merismopedia glauca]PSB01222.1 GNAT family N-acetyltransferase [Merismopedia glauca CCAP 1448/3]
MKIRFATPDDVSLILSFIQKKSEFDRQIGAYSGVLQVTEDKIRKTIFGSIPFSYVVFVENSGVAIGFALYGFRYSSFVGQPSIWLDDLYVDKNMRSQGAGAVLMNHLAQIAKANDCTHIAWTADARNTRGLNFYHRLGAKIIEQKGDRCFFSWTSFIT